jgi:alpha-L-fucosidase 2
MLLQSQGGVIRIFPALPASWQNVAFTRLRAEDAFLISAAMRDGKLDSLQITSEKGGKLRMQNPFRGAPFAVQGARVAPAAAVLEIDTSPGRTITFRRKG